MYLYQRPRFSHYGAEAGSRVGAYIPTHEGLGQGGEEPLLEYLAFEGGGGKGVTFLGAVRALEGHGILPIDIARRGQNQIKGISGASAGAISALLLAMGLNADQLSQILNRPETFTAFFDDPRLGYSRSINEKNEPAEHYVKPPVLTSLRPITDLQGRAFFALLGILFGISNPLFKRIQKNVASYSNNLVLDGGLFPGFAMRAFLASVITKYLIEKVGTKYLTEKVGRPVLGATLSFDEFHKLTGVDLAVTGTNLTSRKSMYFSRWDTPSFSVAEAVGISANLPFVFKPVHVKRGRHVEYDGKWVDGGLLNNLPLHAFDRFGPNPQLRALHPRMLALRLTEGPCEVNTTSRSAKRAAMKFVAEQFPIITYVLDALNSVLALSETGQIRTGDDAKQTIDLCTYCLSTIEFGPSEAAKAAPIANAERKVNEYLVGLKNQRLQSQGLPKQR